MTARALAELKSPLALPNRTINAYRQNGHVLVRNLVSPETVENLRPAVLETGARARFDHRPLEERDTYGKAFVQMMNLWTLDPRIEPFVLAHRLAHVAAQLLGVDAVRLYHDQALFKEPGGGITPWHQDQFYWPLDTADTITLWLPLVPVEANMGPMTFASGSHHGGNLGEFAIGDASHTAFQSLIEKNNWPLSTDQNLRPGDASFHAGWTLHRASPNHSPRLREAFTIIYFAEGSRVGPLDHPAKRLDRDLWLSGCQAGRPAAGPLNPLLGAPQGEKRL